MFKSWEGRVLANLMANDVVAEGTSESATIATTKQGLEGEQGFHDVDVGAPSIETKGSSLRALLIDCHDR